MRYKEIFLHEAPIADFDVHNMEQPGTFSDRDRALLQDPAHVQHVKQRFQHCPYTFNLYFVNQPGTSYTGRPDSDMRDKGQTGRFTAEWYRDMAHAGLVSTNTVRALTGLDVKASPDGITVVFLSNASESFPMPMSPWIIAHRVGHALTDNPGPGSLTQRIPDQNDPIRVGGATTTFGAMMTTKSARQGTLVAGEAAAELIAQYIITGDVPLDIPPDLPHTPVVKMAVQRVASSVLDALDGILDAAVGKMFLAV